MNKDIKEILNYMKQYVENKYEHDSEPMLNYKDLQIVLSYIEQLEKENKNLKENKNEALRYISNYLALDQRYKWNDNVDEKLKLVKNILNGRKKNITNISYEDLLRQNKQLENNRDKSIEICNFYNKKYQKDPLGNQKVLFVISNVINKLKGDRDE